MRYEVTIVYKNNSIKKVFCNAETKEEVDKYNNIVPIDA